MPNLCLPPLLAVLLALPATAQVAELEAALRYRISGEAGSVSLAYLDGATHDSVLLAGQQRYHAASTMKVPVLIELARRIDRGELRWDARLPVRNAFRSIADGSLYRLDAADDSDSTLYGEIGRTVPIARLAHLMIARSSNLATNLLIDTLGPGRVHAAARQLGADSIVVRRGVEDGPAYRRGLNNTTTARDLAVLLLAIAGGRAASVDQSRLMIEILLAQEFNDQIPAGLPAGVKVAHKTGEISGISHDAAIVFPPGRGPYVLVILTEGFGDRQVAARLMADLSATVYRWATRRTDPRE